MGKNVRRFVSKEMERMLKINSKVLAILCFSLFGPVIGIIVAGVVFGGYGFFIMFFGYGFGLIYAGVAGVIFSLVWAGLECIYFEVEGILATFIGAGSGYASAYLMHFYRNDEAIPGFILLASIVSGGVCGYLACGFIKKNESAG